MPTKGNIKQSWMHLTNYALNKQNPEFEFNAAEEDDNTGHKRSLTAVFALLEDAGVDIDKLWAEI
jgi:tubulin polyglutamylase TTLL6/13